MNDEHAASAVAELQGKASSAAAASAVSAAVSGGSGELPLLWAPSGRAQRGLRLGLRNPTEESLSARRAYSRAISSRLGQSRGGGSRPLLPVPPLRRHTRSEGRSSTARGGGRSEAPPRTPLALLGRRAEIRLPARRPLALPRTRKGRTHRLRSRTRARRQTPPRPRGERPAAGRADHHRPRPGAPPPRRSQSPPRRSQSPPRRSRSRAPTRCCRRSPRRRGARGGRARARRRGCSPLTRCRPRSPPRHPRRCRCHSPSPLSLQRWRARCTPPPSDAAPRLRRLRAGAGALRTRPASTPARLAPEGCLGRGAAAATKPTEAAATKSGWGGAARRTRAAPLPTHRPPRPGLRRCAAPAGSARRRPSPPQGEDASRRAEATSPPRALPSKTTPRLARAAA